MKLTEIKNKIVDKLAKLTIDDFYVDPKLDILKSSFGELTGHYNYDEINKYLTERFPETTKFDSKVFSLEESITSKENGIKHIEKKYDNLLTEYYEDYKEENEKVKSIYDRQIEINLELKDIDFEINQIKSLNEYPKFKRPLNELYELKELLNSEKENLNNLIEQIDEKNYELEDNLFDSNPFFTKKNDEVNVIKLEVEELKHELRQLNENDNAPYQNEFLALEFLFRILLQKSIKKVKKNNNISEFDINPLCFDEYYSTIIPLINRRNELLIDWNNYLFQILSNPIPNISGIISINDDYSTAFINKVEQDLTDKDLSKLLALKVSLNSSNYIITIEKKIVLKIPGDLLATVKFRKKGEVISNFQKNKFEIYSTYLQFKKKKEQSMFQQSTIPINSINSDLESGYLILIENYVIEVDFYSDTLFFENDILSRFPHIIKGVIEQYNEIEKEKIRRYNEELFDLT